MITDDKTVMKNKELANCTFIKTILMILMVLYHSIIFWSGTWFTAITPERVISFYDYLTNWMNSFHIYGFALVSGYLFYYVKFERGGIQLVEYL